MLKKGAWITKNGFEKLKRELDEMKNVKRPKLIKAVAQARAHGDLSENAEYDAAKEEQALLEKRIAELETKLAHARIVQAEEIPSNKVYLGATVKLKDINKEKELIYTLVGPEEADFPKGRISISSPVGKSLLGHAVGDMVDVKVPAGSLRYQVLEITRD